MHHSRLPRAFFERPTVEVARALLGQRLVHVWHGQRLSGLVVETEAYVGQNDLACHAHRGRTPRTAPMFGPPGHAYVYFNYGLHWLFNLVTEAEGFPAAVLVRAVWPQEGQAVMAARRHPHPPRLWASGPARLTQALGIDRAFNGYDVCAPTAMLFLEAAPAPSHVVTGPRIGIDRVPEPWRSVPWNFRWPPPHPPF